MLSEPPHQHRGSHPSRDLRPRRLRVRASCQSLGHWRLQGRRGPRTRTRTRWGHCTRARTLRGLRTSARALRRPSHENAHAVLPLREDAHAVGLPQTQSRDGLYVRGRPSRQASHRLPRLRPSGHLGGRGRVLSPEGAHVPGFPSKTLPSSGPRPGRRDTEGAARLPLRPQPGCPPQRLKDPAGPAGQLAQCLAVRRRGGRQWEPEPGLRPQSRGEAHATALDQRVRGCKWRGSGWGGARTWGRGPGR